MRVSLCMFAALATYAQQPQPGTKELSDLITEVRELRLVVERSFITATRSQIVLQQLALQHARVDKLKSDSNKAWAAVADIEARQAHTLDLIRRSETEIQNPNVQLEKKESLVREIAAYKSRLAQEASRDSQLRAAETQAVTEYREALSRLADLEDRLSHIERAATAPVGTKK
jgi:DNA repair exonuclease SbcCD ATPase subunit